MICRVLDLVLCSIIYSEYPESYDIRARCMHLGPGFSPWFGCVLGGFGLAIILGLKSLCVRSPSYRLVRSSPGDTYLNYWVLCCFFARFHPEAFGLDTTIGL